MVDREDTATAQLKIRLRETMRAELEASAKANNHTLNKEVVDRLQRSLAQERTQGGRSAAVLQVAIGTAIRIAEDITGADWRYDYPTYQAARGLIIEALDKYQPDLSFQASVIDARRAALDAQQQEYDAMRALGVALEEKMRPLLLSTPIAEAPVLPAEAMGELQPLLDSVQSARDARLSAEAAVDEARAAVQGAAEAVKRIAADSDKSLEAESE